MSLARIALLAAGSYSPVLGQQQWVTYGVHPFVVPAGVYLVHGVVVDAGTTGTGGSLSWRNYIPVTPGEMLTIFVGSYDHFAPGSLNPTSTLKRGLTTLIPGSSASSGGGGGGSGAYASESAGAGGAGGYIGHGGHGGNPGGQPQLNSGGGIGGDPGSDGGGVGLEGRTAEFAPGSRGLPKCGGGIGEGQSGGPGGVRLMWGIGRSYPDAAADV